MHSTHRIKPEDKIKQRDRIEQRDEQWGQKYKKEKGLGSSVDMARRGFKEDKILCDTRQDIQKKIRV